MDGQRWAVVHTPADLGRFLAEVRVEHGYTQDELADELGISRRYLYEIETGKPSLYTSRLFALLRLLQVSVRVDAAPAGDPAGGQAVAADAPGGRKR